MPAGRSTDVAGAFVIALAPATTFFCTVTRVHDGDGPLWCSNGIKVRIAGVQAPDFENASPCRSADPRRANYRCDNAAAQRSQQIVERLVLRRTLRCEATGKSYSRVVARCTLPDGRSLSCAAIASGAAVRWERYWRQYRMAGRRFAGHECFDCDFDVESGNSHSLTVSVCGANGFVDDDAEVVDAVSALTLIGMLLERLEIRPILIAR